MICMSRVVIKGPSLEEIVKTATTEIKQQLESRTYRASNELRNSALMVLRGTRSGRVYKVPGTHGKRLSKATKGMLDDYEHKLRGGRLYRASAPGEPPAMRTGTFRNSWQPDPRCSGAFSTYWARIKSDARTDNGRFILGDILEEGTPGGQMAPRPHHDRILDHAEEKVVRIYDEPYFK